LFKAENTSKSFVAGLCPDPLVGGAYSVSPDPLAAFDGPTSKRGEGRVGKTPSYATAD